MSHKLSRSLSKQRFSFGKSERFGDLRKHGPDALQYENRDIWSKYKEKPQKRTVLGGKDKRFRYAAGEKHSKEHPSPSKYQIQGSFGENHSGSSLSYNFALGRDKLPSNSLVVCPNSPGVGIYEPTDPVR